MVHATPPAAAPSFEEALAELERIVEGMEDGQAALEDSLAAYARGMALLKGCQAQLNAAERKIQMLEADGLKDFDAGADAAA